MIPFAEALRWCQVGYAVEIPSGSHASVVNGIALGVEVSTDRRFIAERRGDRRYIARIK